MIRFEQVNKVYKTGKPDETQALQNVSFEIQKGELVLLLGSSGSGKSSILSLLAALNKPSSGAVYFEDTCVSKLPDHFASRYRRNHLGFIFQQYNLIPELSAIENIRVPLIPLKLSKEEQSTRLENLLNQFFLSEKAHQPVKLLSGGEQQRVAIARSLVNDPDIILADEPTANLDQKLVSDFIEYIESANQLGKTIIIATHDSRFQNLKIAYRTIKVENGSTECL